MAGGHLGWNEGFSEKEEISTGDHVEVSEGLIGDIFEMWFLLKIEDFF